jgi:16S rRNA (adenine1518-N6/adenine1519-N6)-dimethyltransferase
MKNPKKSLGQNFLIDNNIIQKIISSGKINNNCIFEIGPGTGNLTKEIIKSAKNNLIVVEKDNRLIDELKKINFNYEINIFNDDILKFDIEKNIYTKTVIFGNLPYNISTQILVKLLKFKNWPPKYKRLVLMFQKEVADRILAKCKSPNYGRLSIITRSRLQVVDSFNVTKNCFFPKPKVDSTVLIFEPLKNKNSKEIDLNSLEKITHIFFSNKRKMINKGFKKLFNEPKKTAANLKINLSLRPNQISENEYFRIVNHYKKLNK